MKRHPYTRSLLLASALAFSLPFAAYAQADAQSDGKGHYVRVHAKGGGEHGGRHEGRQGVGRMLRGLGLTEAQRDELFEYRHAQKPALRAKMKEIRKAREALRALAMSEQYDEGRARALADQTAKAMADIALLRANMGNHLFKVLTPEQREKLAQRMAHRRQRGGDHGPGMGGRGRMGGPGPNDGGAGRAPRS